MTITYPRDLPDWARMREPLKFQPAYQQTSDRARGGRQVVDLGPTFWQMSFQTVPLRDTRAFAFQAWLTSLRGGVRLFKAWHPLRRYLLAYPAGYGGLTVDAAPWDGTATLADVGEQLDTVDLAGLPVGLTFSDGDMLSFAYDDGFQALHSVVGGADADGDGEVTLTVEPVLRPDWPEDGVVSLVKPFCLATVLADSIREDWQQGRICTFSFDAEQRL